MQQPITSIKMRGYRKRRVAEAILTWHSAKPTTRINPNLVRVVCISDTHNKQPVLPPGDILIHAGDLTENGSFDEIQAGITWLSSQPHRFKIFVAGNHAVLLDEAFLQKYPERRYGQSKTKADLNWGNVIYLEDSHITLHVPVQPVCQQQQSPLTPATRKITVFGSPWTPQYGISAFQYPPAAGADHWRAAPRSPRLPHRAGCPYLLAELRRRYRRRQPPSLHVFGHIHAAYGHEEVVLDDAVRQAHDDMVIGWGGWRRVASMPFLVLWARVKGMLGSLFGENEEKGKVNVTCFWIGD
ncbi:hypothetical protein C7999DRAFT_43282 [Corynascus novoguineensis]|uniref:Calcineurin-like phosphoesterase domain-containing protein n=1 Tax=Corynascus novoguineensis TaxID=1126955 RepID=A0AAN7HKR7_9PEZI|nr:hypothetical protein C7999DRAFT_43282 [Corynascus novoguineensis]